MSKKACSNELSVNHPSEVAIDAETKDKFKILIGTTRKRLATDLIGRAAYAIPGTAEEHQNELVLEALAEMKPTNVIEGMLCTQIFLLHQQGMQYLGRAEGQDMRCHHLDLNNAIKLLRLQHETIEALSRLRRGGEQKVTVQHQYVQVNDGGQAIVGSNLNTGEGVKQKNEGAHEL